VFEEDKEHTPTRFFPVPDQTTPTWSEKVKELEEIGPQTPEYTTVSTIRYLHALDTLYEDQQRELKKWTTKAKEAEAEVRSLRMELLIMSSQIATLKDKKEYYKQELQKALEGPHTRRIKKGKRTFAMPPNKGYDPRHPHYNLNGYIPRESLSDHDGSNDTEELVVDNFNSKKTAGDTNTTGPSRVPSGQGADGYARELYVLRDEQLAKEKGKAVY